MKIVIAVICATLTTAPLAQADSIYRCSLADGSVALQQQPCSSVVGQKIYSFPNSTSRPETRGPAALPEANTAKPLPQQRSQRTNRSPRSNPVGKRLKQCRTLWNREDDLRETEREGYTAREGEKIRRQLRRIKRDKKLLRCEELK